MIKRAFRGSIVFCGRAFRRVRMAALRPLFGSHGRRFWFDPSGLYTFENIHVGEDVSLGMRPTLWAARSRIVIGDKVMFGPYVKIFGGNHTVSLVGRWMKDIDGDEKMAGDDIGVTIGDDIWIGSGAIILAGANIGRGSIIAAGSVVTKPVPPYSVAAGVPAKVLKRRWDVETILRHEAALYPPEKRLSRKDLELK
jgi:acetyltransferase-like isoleucine patch superfamily enzyme